jgi:hypothetical protein
VEPSVVKAQLLDEVKDHMALVAAGRAMADISAEMELLSGLFQAVAICHLLESLDVQEFRANLMRSAQARIYFLRKSREQGNLSDRRLALGRTEALLDALAAGSTPLVQELARHVVSTWHPGWEYEEDHLYFLSLQALATKGPGEQVDALLARYAALQPDPLDPRFNVTRALARRDAVAFEQSLLQLMADRDETQQTRLAQLLEPDIKACLHWPRCFVSIEGLALLALARRMKLATPDLVPLCPADAQLAPSDALTEDFFAGIERILAVR